MTNWHNFIPSGFEYDAERDKLAAHSVTIEEAIECFYNNFDIGKNKDYSERFKLLGRTNGGRRLCIIFQLKINNIVRIITGWEM
jgi:uncharacterized DUF497 family protein